MGRLAIISGNEVATQDIPPFAAMKLGALKGYNAVGCKRAGMSRQAIHAIRAAYRILHAHRVVGDAVDEMSDLSEVPEVAELIAFIQASKRGIVPSVAARSLTIGEPAGAVDRDAG